MVFLVTQFPKPIITEHWEDLPPAKLSGGWASCGKELRNWPDTCRGQGGGSGDEVHTISPQQH